MKSVVAVEIDAPRDRVAVLYADPRNNTKWMDDIARCEQVSGEPGMPGSVYRLIPKKGSMTFIATVVRRDLPDALSLRLDASNISVDARGTLSTLPDGRTQLVSEQEFEFKSFWGKLFAPLAGPAINKAHRRHMKAFKKFAEGARAWIPTS